MADLIRFVDSVAGINLITNSSFEVDTAGWTPTNGTFSRVGDAGVSGAFVGAFVSTAVASQWVTHTLVPATAGLPYSGSVWLKMQGASSNYTITILWYAGAGFLSSSTVTYLSSALSGTVFTRMEISGTAPATADGVRIQVAPVTNLAIGAGFRIDGAMITQTSAPIPYVDASGGSTRLDLNDETTFWVKSFNAPPPRLRRSVASNAMRDGISVGSSSYDGRTLTIELECRRTTQDLAATEIQKLWRELDRETNFLMYQPTGATKPVFFRTFRSDASQLEDVMAQAAMRRFTIEVLAEPFALGLRESLGPYTVNNDPAAGSNGCFVDVSGVIGDVATPPVIVDTGVIPHYWTIGVRQHGTPSSVTWFLQAESDAGGVNTSNPGGGPDAAMSGTGTNNYLRTSFANTVNDLRMSLTVSGLLDPGDYRILAVVRRSDATSDMLAQVGNILGGMMQGQIVIPKTTERQIVEVGTWSIDSGIVGNNATGAMTSSDIGIYAQRTAGTGTLDWDFFLFMPADEAGLVKFYEGTAGPNNLLLDCVNQTVRGFDDGADPFTGTGTMYHDPSPIGVSGSYPSLRPNQTNRFVMLASTGTVAGRTPTKTQTLVLTFHYWPRYLFVRPVST